jgi:hypothetical protein
MNNSLREAEERLLAILAKSYNKDIATDEQLKNLLLAVYAAGKISGGQR